MATSGPYLPKHRHGAAQRVAAVLYGVIAIMTAELSVQAGELSYSEAACGALLVGIAMTVARIFVDVVEAEVATDERLPMRGARAIVINSLLVMVFPVITALSITIAALTTTRWTLLLDLVLYLGMATVFVIGFLSSYLLHRQVRRALARGMAWLLLGVLLVVAKSFV